MDEAKCELIRAWLVKARSDLGTARKLAAGPERFPDTAVYHCQQAAEKAIKAFLVFHDHRSPKSHDIRLLIQESTPFDPALTELEDAGDVLTLSPPPIAIRARFFNLIGRKLSKRLSEPRKYSNSFLLESRRPAIRN